MLLSIAVAGLSIICILLAVELNNTKKDSIVVALAGDIDTTPIAKLNADERFIFDSLMGALDSFHNKTAARLYKVVLLEEESERGFLLQVQGANRMGGMATTTLMLYDIVAPDSKHKHGDIDTSGTFSDVYNFVVNEVPAYEAVDIGRINNAINFRWEEMGLT